MRHSLRSRVLLLLVAAGGLVLAGISPAPAADTARVTLVHGVRGLVADVSLDGKPVLSGFGFEQATDALPIPAGKHQVTVKAADDGSTVLEVPMVLRAGQDLTAVAGFDANGGATAYVFDNRLPTATRGPGAVVLRHAAGAEAATLLVDGKQVGDPMNAGDQFAASVKPGRHKVSVTGADGSTWVPETSVTVPAGKMVSVILVGRASNDSLGMLTLQQSPAADSARTIARVAGGGRPPTDDQQPAAGLVATAAVVLAAGAFVVLGVRRRLAPLPSSRR